MYRQYFTGRTHAHFLVVHFTRDCTCGSRYDESLWVFSKIILSSVMSLLGVPSTSFPHVFSSTSTSQTTPATSPALSTGIRLNPCATPLGDGLSGRLARAAQTHWTWREHANCKLKKENKSWTRLDIADVQVSFRPVYCAGMGHNGSA